MYNKTSSHEFLKYRYTVNTFPQITDYHEEILELEKKYISEFYYSEHELYIQVNEGIAMLCVSDQNDLNSIKNFVIHHIVKLHPNTYFNLFSITDTATLKILKHNNYVLKVKETKKNNFIYDRFLSSFTITEILAYYYQVKNTNYSFTGESHNFWELTFVDNGHLITMVDGKEYHLNQYDCILYAPNQFHSEKTDNQTPCAYLKVMFEATHFPADILKDTVFHASRKIIRSMHEFIQTIDLAEAKVNNYYKDLCICYLNEILLQFLLIHSSSPIKPANSPLQQKFEDDFLNKIISYIQDNIDTPINVEQICNDFSISRSSLQQIFKNNLNITPKQYINDLKLKKAKYLIRSNQYTISEISDKLGYTSIHYFSRKFKQEFQITPSEYAKVIYDEQK